MAEKKYIYCTRPALISVLQAADVKIKETPNVFNPDKKAWLYENTESARHIARLYYLDTNQQLPDYLK